VPSIAKVVLSLLIVTLVTGTFADDTVTTQAADVTPSAVAVMFVVPAVLPVTKPVVGLTVATAVLLLAHESV
jgi:hypothetical protein